MFTANLKLWASEYFNIDKLGKGFISKLLFVFMLGLKLFISFLPDKYSDFTPFIQWMNAVMNGDSNATLAVIPLTLENWIFIGLALIVAYVCLMTSVFYSGLVLRDLRTNRGVNNIPISSFWGRFLILCMVMGVVALPIAFVAVYLIILFLFAIPIISTIPVCYLSGDKKFFASIGESGARTRGFYILIIRDFSGTYLIYLIAGFLVSLLGYVSYTAYAVVRSSLDVWYYMVFARICAYSYLMTRTIRIVNKTNKI